MSAHLQTSQDLQQNLDHLNAAQLRRLLTEQLTRQKLGLYWKSNPVERDAALNANIVLPHGVGGDNCRRRSYN